MSAMQIMIDKTTEYIVICSMYKVLDIPRKKENIAVFKFSFPVFTMYKYSNTNNTGRT